MPANPCAAANGGIASLLQSPRLVAAVAELGSFGNNNYENIHPSAIGFLRGIRADWC
jgi:hypothetical protein